jgi:hypothetical protein
MMGHSASIRVARHTLATFALCVGCSIQPATLPSGAHPQAALESVTPMHTKTVGVSGKYAEVRPFDNTEAVGAQFVVPTDPDQLTKYYELIRQIGLDAGTLFIKAFSQVYAADIGKIPIGSRLIIRFQELSPDGEVYIGGFKKRLDASTPTFTEVWPVRAEGENVLAFRVNQPIIRGGNWQAKLYVNTEDTGEKVVKLETGGRNGFLGGKTRIFIFKLTGVPAR